MEKIYFELVFILTLKNVKYWKSSLSNINYLSYLKWKMLDKYNLVTSLTLEE